VCAKLNTTRGCGLVLELGYFGLIVLISCCVAGGVCAAVVHTWSLRALTYDLSNRLAVVEGTLTREVKARAGQERWRKPDKDAALAESLIQQPVQRKLNWWQVNLPRSAPR
jgi:hypothetical protein